MERINSMPIMLRFFPGEEWKEFLPEHKLKFRYAVSNFGRLISFSDKIENGRLLKGGLVEGYRLFRYKIFNNKKISCKYFFVSKLVAMNFLPPKTEEQKYVLHLNYNKSNDHYTNLRWATREEMLAHQEKSPAVIKNRPKLQILARSKISKLSPEKVLLLKKKIFDTNRTTRFKIIARQFGITPMQLYRIKSGENWSHIKLPEREHFEKTGRE